MKLIKIWITSIIWFSLINTTIATTADNYLSDPLNSYSLPSFDFEPDAEAGIPSLNNVTIQQAIIQSGFSVYAWNVGAGSGIDSTAVRNQIIAMNPDILLLCEAGTQQQVDNLAAHLNTQLSTTYHVYYQEAGDSKYPLAFLSKYSYQSTETILHPKIKKALLKVVININNKDYTFYGLHAATAKSQPPHEKEAEQFLTEIQSGVPTIVLGDFNSRSPLDGAVHGPTDPTYSTDGWSYPNTLSNDLFTAAGWIDTWRYHYPDAAVMATKLTKNDTINDGSNLGERIDYIWVSPDLENSILAAGINTETTNYLSDHKPVWARIDAGGSITTSGGQELDDTPTIANSSLAANNRYLDITFTEGVYRDSSASQALTVNNFEISFDPHATGSATGVTINSVKQADNEDEQMASPLIGGETTVRLFFNINGIPNGEETIKIHLAGENASAQDDTNKPPAHIYNSAGIADHWSYVDATQVGMASCIRTNYHHLAKSHSVTFMAQSGGTVNGNNQVQQGVAHGFSSTSVTALPDNGHYFVNWTQAGQKYSTNPTLALDSVTGDVTFTAHFAPVNDPPHFTPGSDQTYPAGTHGGQTVAGWATAIDAGAADESTQTLTFKTTVVNDPEGILSGTPVINNSTGDLNYSLTGKNGRAKIEVVLQDDGGTTNGGVDTSATVMFLITVGVIPNNTTPILDNSGLIPISASTPRSNLQILPSTMTLSVSLAGNGNGHVKVDPGDIDCDKDDEECKYTYDTATHVTLTPIANPGSEFRYWAGNKDCNDGDVFMVGNPSCVAYFVLSSNASTATTANNDPSSQNSPNDPSRVTPSTNNQPGSVPTTPVQEVNVTVPIMSPGTGIATSQLAGIHPPESTLPPQPTMAPPTPEETVLLPPSPSTPEPMIPTMISTQRHEPNCLSENWLDWICNAQGHTITDLEIGPNGNLSNAILKGTVKSRGWASNLTLKPQAFFSGGIVTGDINNEGTMANFEFRGFSLMGGTLEGDIVNNSTIGGWFKDVHLAANTRVKGGKVLGLITGDPQAPAWLENLEIAPGTVLNHVIIGNNVKLAANVTLGEGVQFIEGNQLDCVANGIKIDANGHREDNETCFIGPINRNDDQPTNQVRLVHPINVSATLIPEPEYVGEPAEIIIVGKYRTFSSQTNYMRAKEGWIRWDGNLATLQPADFYKQLPKMLEIPIYEGHLKTEAQFTFLVGYRLKEGTLIYNGREPINFLISKTAGIVQCDNSECEQ